ncbi:class I SAM-dependent methyltransferase [Aurantiacibacter spongiae]|uniref:Methyltransferase n=1 Tax=Aurantiacibacter spongiae TaxID=2488860 RepID=A0A3N5CTP3_9SPHN|nr:class I SAM-dependent methyltransferase [Aurantiacibacter spongiae]RPF72563.1 methyltransferase [Aurantiacibacter spongiae]
MPRKALTTAAAALSLALLPGCVSVEAGDPFADVDLQRQDYILAAVVSPARPAEDTARDAARKPAEIVAFSGLRRGDTVAEIAPGGGYYTRILSQVVGPEGRVYAILTADRANRPGGRDAIDAIAEQYGNVEVVVVDSYAGMSLPRPVDLVWTTENYHDLANGDIAGANRAVFAALKPGGLYFVEDHAAPGTGTDATATLHRIDPEAVRNQVSAAGFALEAESDLLANPADPHTARVFDYEGTTDKFALRFRKPG